MAAELGRQRDIVQVLADLERDGSPAAAASAQSAKGGRRSTHHPKKGSGPAATQ
jgi:hypothetical protein